jgi:hypothetical protein
VYIELDLIFELALEVIEFEKTSVRIKIKRTKCKPTPKASKTISNVRIEIGYSSKKKKITQD